MMAGLGANRSGRLFAVVHRVRSEAVKINAGSRAGLSVAVRKLPLDHEDPKFRFDSPGG